MSASLYVPEGINDCLQIINQIYREYKVYKINRENVKLFIIFSRKIKSS